MTSLTDRVLDAIPIEGADIAVIRSQVRNDGRGLMPTASNIRDALRRLVASGRVTQEETVRGLWFQRVSQDPYTPTESGGVEAEHETICNPETRNPD